jgi:para-nitrobenzyl esterase
MSFDLDCEVTIAGGTVRGLPRDDRGVLSFKGIPYASAPAGDLRWRAPQPARAWTGVRDATRYGNRALSALTGDQTPGPPRNQDCLNLNVWTAANRSDERRPVMVWIHGGGFQFGSSSMPVSDGTRLAALGAAHPACRIRLRPCAGFKPTSHRSAATRTTSRCSANPPALTPSAFFSHRR